MDDYPVAVELPVAWGDMDAFGHVNNTVYIRWFETARIVSRRLDKELQHGPFLCGRSAPTVADLSAYGAILPGFELGLAGGGAMLKRPSILQWAKRVQATLDPSLPLVPDSVRARTFS